MNGIRCIADAKSVKLFLPHNFSDQERSAYLAALSKKGSIDLPKTDRNLLDVAGRFRVNKSYSSQLVTSGLGVDDNER